MISDALRKRLRLPRLGQIGYVVTDLDRTMSYYKDTFGMGPWILVDGRPDPCVESGRSICPRLRIAVAYSGAVQIELIQVAEGESFHLSHVEESLGGVHHLGFWVRDMNKRLDACHEAGIGILQRGTITDSVFKADYAYLDTAHEAGIILELIHMRLRPVPLPMSRFTHNVGCWAASGTLLRGRVVK